MTAGTSKLAQVGRITKTCDVCGPERGPISTGEFSMDNQQPDKLNKRCRTCQKTMAKDRARRTAHFKGDELKIKDVAKRLEKTESAIVAMIETGELPAVDVGTGSQRFFRIDSADLKLARDEGKSVVSFSRSIQLPLVVVMDQNDNNNQKFWTIQDSSGDGHWFAAGKSDKKREDFQMMVDLVNGTNPVSLEPDLPEGLDRVIDFADMLAMSDDKGIKFSASEIGNRLKKLRGDDE